jgi:hypothetical protein
LGSWFNCCPSMTTLVLTCSSSKAGLYFLSWAGPLMTSIVPVGISCMEVTHWDSWFCLSKDILPLSFSPRRSYSQFSRTLSSIKISII